MTTPPPSPTANGGNTTLVNQDEKMILDRCNTAPVQVVGFQADDSHIDPQFRERGI